MHLIRRRAGIGATRARPHGEAADPIATLSSLPSLRAPARLGGVCPNHRNLRYSEWPTDLERDGCGMTASRPHS